MVASALVASAFAAEPPRPEGVNAGATVRDRSGWSASLFVAYVDRMSFADGAAAPLATTPVVNATVSRRLTRSTRLTFDVFNVFDRRVPGLDYIAAARAWDAPAASDNFLFHPGEPRGFRLRLRFTF